MTTSKLPVLILGARSDMAQAIAAEFAGRGHPLMLAARRADTLDDQAADLRVRHGAEVTTHDFDVLDLDAQAGFYDALPAAPGIVVCAIGVLGDQDADAGNIAATRLIVDSNFVGPCLMLEYAAAKMNETDADTAIIGIGSVAGDRGRAKNYVYGAAKAGFAEYLSGLRQKYARSRVHVMTVKPGFVRTSMTEGMDLPGPLTSDPDDFAARVVKAYEKGRMVYYDLRWNILMGVIKHVPERIFSKMKF